MWILIFFLITLPFWWLFVLFILDHWLDILLLLGKIIYFLFKFGLICALIIGIIYSIFKSIKYNSDIHKNDICNGKIVIIPSDNSLSKQNFIKCDWISKVENFQRFSDWKVLVVKKSNRTLGSVPLIWFSHHSSDYEFINNYELLLEPIKSNP